MAGEWENLTLGDLGRIVTGKTPLTAVEGNFGGNIPFVTPSDMDGRKIISNTARYLTQAGAASVKGSVIPAGAIMVSCIGSDMGKVVSAGRDCVTNQQINSIVVDDRFSSEFVYYSLSTRKNEIRHNAAGGSAVPILNKGDFSCLEIKVPPLAEQKAIAAILGSLDDKIELNRRMNATLEAMARALFQSWFVDFDPVRAKLDGRVPVGMDAETAALFPAGFDESALGHIPLGWQLGRFGDLCNLKRGHDLPSSTRKVGLIPVISSSGISGMHSETSVRGPGVVTGRYGTIGKVFFVETDYWPLNTTLYVEDFKKNPPRFIFHALGEVNFSNYTDKAAVPGVNRNHLHEEPTVISSMEVRQAFAHIVELLWTKHAANCAQSRTLATLRDTLLPKLLSGELSVAQAAKELSAP